MDSRGKANLYEQLRSVSNSTAVNKASIVVDASRYIEDLKERVHKLNQDVASLQSSSNLPALQVKVETLEKGFLINVFSEKNCPGLLVSILEAFQDLNLQVLDARASCSHNFSLQAISDQNEGQCDSIDAQVVKQAVVQAIMNWGENNEYECKN
ncbi:hypothetical protein ACJIZ3_022214 [Penstemon smallii]|uniref:Plant bHLH transcription factor ACT-like domain-containing protein n=1 Tax=Penstemon smallii TaxID=265156 RepID=A0ABD3SNZ4_9LAMI